jgi:hypothetical protein
MNLSDYISLTLNEIAEGVKKASDTLKPRGGYILKESPIIDGTPYARISSSKSHPIINVTFRVGVELEESKGRNDKIGGSIKVISIDHESIKKGEKRSTHEVSFELPLVLHQ